jgi:hypothetical protein
MKQIWTKNHLIALQIIAADYSINTWRYLGGIGKSSISFVWIKGYRNSRNGRRNDFFLHRTTSNTIKQNTV